MPLSANKFIVGQIYEIRIFCFLIQLLFAKEFKMITVIFLYAMCTRRILTVKREDKVYVVIWNVKQRCTIMGYLTIYGSWAIIPASLFWRTDFPFPPPTIILTFTPSHRTEVNNLKITQKVNLNSNLSLVSFHANYSFSYSDVSSSTDLEKIEKNAFAGAKRLREL